MLAAGLETRGVATMNTGGYRDDAHTEPSTFLRDVIKEAFESIREETGFAANARLNSPAEVVRRNLAQMEVK